MSEIQTIVKVSKEKERGCGYKQVGGTYLIGGEGISLVCDRLPLRIGVCDCCGETIRFSRGIQKLNPLALWGMHETCQCPPVCPLCHPDKNEANSFFMWVGSEYTTESFQQEAFEMGVSKRLSIIPKDLEVGKSWVYLGKQGLIKEKAGYDAKKGRVKKVDGVFYAFKVETIEHWLGERDATEEKLQELKDKGITPVIVPETEANQEHFGRTVKPERKIEPDTRMSLDVFTSTLDEEVKPTAKASNDKTTAKVVAITFPAGLKWPTFLKYLKDKGLSLSRSEKTDLWHKYKHGDKQILTFSL